MDDKEVTAPVNDDKGSVLVLEVPVLHQPHHIQHRVQQAAGGGGGTGGGRGGGGRRAVRPA